MQKLKQWFGRFFGLPPHGKIKGDSVRLFNLPEGTNHISIIDRKTKDIYFNTVTRYDELTVVIPKGAGVIVHIIPQKGSLKMSTLEIGGDS